LLDLQKDVVYLIFYFVILVERRVFGWD